MIMVGGGVIPNRLYINDAAVPIPEIHKEINYGGENGGHTDKIWGYGYAFVSKGDVLSFRYHYYDELKLGCTTKDSSIDFVPYKKH